MGKVLWNEARVESERLPGGLLKSIWFGKGPRQVNKDFSDIPWECKRRNGKPIGNSAMMLIYYQGKMGEACTCSMCMRWQDKWIPEIQHACVDSAWQLGKALILLIQHEMNGCPTHSNLSST